MAKSQKMTMPKPSSAGQKGAAQAFAAAMNGKSGNPRPPMTSNKQTKVDRNG